jgi:3-oxoacyl-[acyl-carrier-protein] synthase II
VLGTAERAEDCCRPFDLRRNGTVLGEGAAFLVLEPLAQARARGATVHALLGGWSMAADLGGRAGTHESGEALYQCMSDALAMASLEPGQVDYVNAHGTGTRLNDRVEAQAIRRLFSHGVPCSSTKAVTGHCMGAAAALEALVCILALQRQRLPPSAGLDELDPECPVAPVRQTARLAEVRAVLSNSSGFWGHTAALLFRAAPPA